MALGTVFSYTTQYRSVNNVFILFFFPDIPLGKETEKKDTKLTNHHIVWLKASSSGCKILFFTLPTLAHFL